MTRRAPKRCKSLTVDELAAWEERLVQIRGAMKLLEPLASEEMVDAVETLRADVTKAREIEEKR